MKFGTLTAMVLAMGIAASAPASAQMLAGENEADITAIDGVVSGGAEWELAWAGFMTADGMAGTPDGGLLFAQEQSNSIHKLGPDGNEYIFDAHVAGPGAVSVDAEGRVFTVERTCTDPGLHMESCNELTRVTQIRPEHRILASSFADGRPLGRLNDVMADGMGGAYFTVGGIYHAAADGTVSVVAEDNIRTNGLMLSPDGKTLYVTNGPEVDAFDVKKDGSTANRRVFATLDHEGGQGFGGDGMAVDSEGRLYVTGSAGLYVFDSKGKELGVIPTKRHPITVAFSGPDKKTLFIGSMGAVGPDGKAWETPKGVRNVAMTVYKLNMDAMGFKGRPK